MSEATVTAIIVAIISGMSVAIPTIIATLSSNKAHDCLYDEIGNTYVYDTVANDANIRGFIAS